MLFVIFGVCDRDCLGVKIDLLPRSLLSKLKGIVCHDQMKVKQKISGGFRTTEGTQVFVTIRSFISTMRKQGENIFTALAAAMAGNVPTVA